jgi:DNA-binding MarR family transcriptional regulator
MSSTAPEAGEPRWLTDEQQRTWRQLAAVLQLLPAALDRQLQEEAGVSHVYYMILAMLSESPQRSMRMAQLAQLTNTSQSRLSHAVSRLEERGWVERRRSGDDRRGQICRLTEPGFGVLEEIAPGHVHEVRRRIFDRLTPEQTTQLGDILAVIVAGLVQDSRPPLEPADEPQLTG